MKPPVKLDDLREEWCSNDSIIDETEPGKELIRVSALHGKYLNILSYHRMLSRKYVKEYENLKLIKTQYYLGELSFEELQERGWEPEQRNISKPSLPLYMDADEDLTNLLIKKMIQDEIVDLCTLIIKELNSRVYALRAFIEWKKMTS
jgi:hypothetical protein